MESGGAHATDSLDNETRAQIYDIVTESPGLCHAALADRIEVEPETVRYHGRVLEENGLVKRAKIRGKRRLFSATMTSEAMELAAARRDESTATALRTLARVEPISVSDLADELGRATSTVSYHIRRLSDAGLVERERDGATVLVSLNPQIRPFLVEKFRR